jgi:hypothetical protein
MEMVERRVLGAVQFIDAVTRSPVREFVRVESAGSRLIRNRQALYIIWEATGLESHATAFESPPTVPALESLELALTVSDAGRSYLPRRAVIRLPRDPNPANASAPNSLFRPIEIALLPSPAAAASVNWALLHATVLDQATGRPLPGALIRVLRASDASVLARGMTDWRGRVVGEALVAVPNIPITTFNTGGGAVLTTQVAVNVEAIFDPRFDPAEDTLPDPDDVEARRASLRRATMVTQLSAGQRRSFSIQVP